MPVGRGPLGRRAHEHRRHDNVLEAGAAVINGEIERSCLDVTRARQELGWSSRVDLAEGLGHTVRWAQANRVAIGAAA